MAVAERRPYSPPVILSEEPLPDPGTMRAIALGCMCPVIDNGHGQGFLGGVKVEGETQFVFAEDCLLHGSHDGGR